MYKEDIRNIQLPDLSHLANSSILVTGSTGLIGKCLVRMLHYHNKDSKFIIFAGCRNIKKARALLGIEENECFKYVEIDVSIPINSEYNFDYIIDAASGASPSQFKSDPVGVMKANLLGVCNLLDYGVTHGLKRFLYVSSGEVYGQGSGNNWREDEVGFVDQMTLRAAYPSSKRCAETLCVAYAKQYGVNTVVARLCHTYGPEFQIMDDRAYAQFFRNAKAHKAIILKSKGGQRRSWLYVVDSAAAIIYILVNGVNINAYNVASENSVATVAEFAETVANTCGLNVEYEMINDDNATPIQSALFDTQKINTLGWRPCFNLKEGIFHSIKWLLD